MHSIEQPTKQTITITTNKAITALTTKHNGSCRSNLYRAGDSTIHIDTSLQSAAIPNQKISYRFFN